MTKDRGNCLCLSGSRWVISAGGRGWLHLEPAQSANTIATCQPCYTLVHTRRRHPRFLGSGSAGHADFPGLSRARGLPGLSRARGLPGLSRARGLPGLSRARGLPGLSRARGLARSRQAEGRDGRSTESGWRSPAIVLPLASRAAACGRAILGSSRQVTATPVSTVMSMSAMASGRPAGEVQTSNQASAAISVAVAAVPARDACTLWRGQDVAWAGPVLQLACVRWGR